LAYRQSVKPVQAFGKEGQNFLEDAYQIAFDCGDNGFVRLDRKQLETLAGVISTLLGP
jgi:hypothetical protein